MIARRLLLVACIAGAAIGAATTSHAEDDYVIGISAGLTGYAAPIDRSWADGARVGADIINREGGILGKKIKLLIQDNRSQPQDSVSAYKAMIGDGAQLFLGGFLSAGNFAAAPIVVRQRIPMMVGSILPKEENLLHWMFTVTPQPAFDVGIRLAYLAKHTDIRKVGIIYDESPFSTVQTAVAKKLAPTLGISIVGAEQFANADPDLSVQIKKLDAAGAGAILRMGTGPGTLTAARDISALGLKMLLLTTEQDVTEFRGIAKILGKRFFFSADPPQVVGLLADNDPAKKVILKFLGPWRKAYGDRDPTYAGRAYDALTAVAEAARISGSLDGAAIRDGLEKVHGLQGTGGIYNFDESHYGLTKNPMVLAQIINGRVTLAK
jgi:ABC-type branched-subunit amino acid transport system substrate-binding protein